MTTGAWSDAAEVLAADLHLNLTGRAVGSSRSWWGWCVAVAVMSSGGRPWRLPLADRVLLIATYWRTNLTFRQVAPLFGISEFAADRARPIRDSL
jgi:hypothetical protein